MTWRIGHSRQAMKTTVACCKHLSVGSDAMTLSVGIERLVADFLRKHKCSLGSELRRSIRSMLGLVVRAARWSSQTPCWSGIPWSFSAFPYNDEESPA